MLGLKTMIDERGLLTGNSFTGTNAIQAYQFLTGDNNLQAVPYTNESGRWTEEAMRIEIITPFLNAGSNPVGIVTIAALEDLGFAQI